jgi:crotonobetainyl-CoA:carnitine CoA-transferase CaiB-like acyl-CoA transferase
MPCHTLETLPDDPHLKAVGFLGSETHPTEGETVSIRSSVMFEGAPLPLREPAQPMGWDSEAILAEIGLSADDVRELLAVEAVHARRSGG